MGRRRLHRVRNKRFWHHKFFLYLIMLFFCIFVYGIWRMEENLRPMLLLIAQSKVKKIAQQAMLEGIREIQVNLGDSLNEIIHIEKEKNGRIAFVNMNAKLQATIYEYMVERVQNKLMGLTEQVLYIKIGQILQSQVLSAIGPSIKLQMWPKGASKVSISPHMESKGINMVMVTLQINVHTEMGVVVPFTEQHFPVSFSYPLAQVLVVGDVPSSYYSFNNDKTQKHIKPNIDLPNEVSSNENE